MTSLELQLLKRLGLPEQSALLSGARFHRPGFFEHPGRGRRLRGYQLRRLLARIQFSGCTIQSGYVHTLTLHGIPNGLIPAIERWLTLKVLTTKHPAFSHCAVSVNPASRGRTCIVILMAKVM